MLLFIFCVLASEKDVSDVLSNLCGTKRFQDLFTKALVAGDTVSWI